MDRDALVARADANYYDAFRRLTVAMDGGEVIEGDGMLLIRTGVPLARFNLAFVTRPLADAAAMIARAVAYFDGHRLPFVVRMRAGIDEAVAHAAETCGLPYRDTVPGMTLAPIAQVPPPPAALEVRVVRDRRTLGDHCGVLAASFGMPREMAVRLLNDRLLGSRDTELYVGYADGAPVASSALIVTDRVAGVWSVGCLPSHRRRGFGEAMTWHAIGRGAEKGCDMANLQASEMGQAIYARMGFETVAEYRTFARPEY